MDTQILYGYSYTDDTTGDNRMTIYQGIEIPTIRRTYSVVRHLGNVNITQRYFLKSRKFPRKIERIENEVLFLNDTTSLRTIQDILLVLGYQQDFIDVVRNTVVTAANNKAISTHERCKDRIHRYGDIYNHIVQEIPTVTAAILTGKVSF